jgi:hypothetical protein
MDWHTIVGTAGFAATVAYTLFAKQTAAPKSSEGGSSSAGDSKDDGSRSTTSSSGGGPSAYETQKVGILECSKLEIVIPSKDISFLFSDHEAVNEYYLFHFGSATDNMPYPFGPKDALNFVERLALLGKPFISEIIFLTLVLSRRVAHRNLLFFR